MKKAQVDREPSALERADTIWHLCTSLEAIGAAKESGGYVAPKDILIMLEHRLRAALRDGPCPECPDCSLHAALEEAISQEPKK